MENNQSETKEKSPVDKIGSLTKQLEKNWQIISKANNTWDFRSLEKSRSAYAGAVEELSVLWPVCLDKLNDDAMAETAYIASDDYRVDLEQALQAAGIPLQGAFPTYEFPPFKLSIDVQNLEAKLKVGRKIEKTTAMNPRALAAWVEKLYQSLVGKKFDTAGFLKELLAAYKFANKIAFRDDEVQWGRAVHLDTLYELLTLKRTSRQDYPKPLFVYDVGRLKEQPDMVLDEYRFELGFARAQEKSILIVDSQGRESRLSSLTVYKAVN